MALYGIFKNGSPARLPIVLLTLKWYSLYSAQDKANELGYYYPVYVVRRIRKDLIIQLRGGIDE